MEKLGQNITADAEKQSLKDKKEQLRASKKYWNANATKLQKTLKEFKSELFALKHVINGRVKDRERIKLEEQLPESNELIESLNKKQEYSSSIAKSIANEARQIINFQNEFSSAVSRRAEAEKKIESESKSEKLKTSSQEYYLLANAFSSETVSPIQIHLKNIGNYWPFLDKRSRNINAILGKIYDLDQKYSELEDLILKFNTYKEGESLESMVFNLEIEINGIINSPTIRSLLLEETNIGTSKSTNISPDLDVDTIFKKISHELGLASLISAAIEGAIGVRRGNQIERDTSKEIKILISRIRKIIFDKHSSHHESYDPVTRQSPIKGIKSLYDKLVDKFKFATQVVPPENAINNLSAIEYIYNKLDSSKIFSDPSAGAMSIDELLAENDNNALSDGGDVVESLLSKGIKGIKYYLKYFNSDKISLYDHVHNEIRPRLAEIMNQLYYSSDVSGLIKSLESLGPLNAILTKGIKSIKFGLYTPDSVVKAKPKSQDLDPRSKARHQVELQEYKHIMRPKG